MERTDLFEEKVLEGAEILIDIKDTHKDNIKKLSDMFRSRFGREPKEFQLLVKSIYYTEGVPKETSKGKLVSLLENFVVIANWYKVLGRENEITRVLKNFGITLNFEENFNLESIKDKNEGKFKAYWMTLFPNEEEPTTDKEILERMIESASESFASIESLKEEISSDLSLEVEQNCKVNKKVFATATSLKAKKLDGKDITDKIAAMEETADQLSQAVDHI